MAGLGKDAAGEFPLLEESFAAVIDTASQHHPVEEVEKAFAGLLVHLAGVHFGGGQQGAGRVKLFRSLPPSVLQERKNSLREDRHAMFSTWMWSRMRS